MKITLENFFFFTKNLGYYETHVATLHSEEMIDMSHPIL